MPTRSSTAHRFAHRTRNATAAALLTLAGADVLNASRSAIASGVEPSEPLSLVGLGDSFPGAPNCDAPCRSYVEVLGQLAETTLGEPVTVSNLATNDSLTTDTLLSRIRSDPHHIEALSNAEIITIQIGFNDWQGPCFWSGHEECVAATSDHVHDNLELILDEIDTLRDGAPTAVRVVTYFDHTIGDPGTPGAWGFEPQDDAAFHNFYSSALAAFNAMMCEVAETHGAGCVGLVEAFNGPSGDSDPGDLVGGDHLHPTQSGHELIAATIDDVGYAPLDEIDTQSTTSMTSTP
jgi:lysophospholipase L1-like esterase